MKKIKTINKLLSSLTLLSPLSSIGFNNQYQNTQKVITENNSSLSNYFSTNAEPIQMGDIWVTVDNSRPTIITGYSSGNGTLTVTSDITQIAAIAFESNSNIKGLDLSQATNLTIIDDRAFSSCVNLTGDITFPSNEQLSVGGHAFQNDTIDNLYFLSESERGIAFRNDYSLPTVTGKVYIPEGTWDIYNRYRHFNFDSSQVVEWSFDSSSSSISGTFDSINIQPTESGNTQVAYNLSGGSSVEGLYNSFKYELVPSESGQTVPNGLYFYDRKIYWNNVPYGYYEFKIKASLNENNFVLSNKTITIVSEDRVISGETNINLIENTTGSQKFSSSPESFSPDQWEIVMTQGSKPDWLSIDNQGLLSWTERSTKGTYTFKVKATNTTYATSAESQEITLNVYAKEPSKFNIGLILALIFGLGIILLSGIGFIIWYLIKKKKYIVKK